MEEQNDHELGEFCFRCSAKDSCYDVPALEPLYNPWPLIARSDQLEYMRSQPIVRMAYSPVSLKAVVDINNRQIHTPANPAQLTADHRADFITWFNWLHEAGHLWGLNWTPVKEFAKIYQAGIYTAIKQLLYEPRLRSSRIEYLWERFNLYSGKLNDIAKNIGFVEELVATANAIAALEAYTQSGQVWAGFQEELETCKEAVLHQEAEVFSDFQVTYERFAPLMSLMYRNSMLRSYVMPLLQPVRLYEEQGLKRVDGIKNSRENLQTILSLIEGVDNANEVIQRLEPLYQEVVLGWQAVLALQVSGMQNAYKEAGFDDWIVQMLWRITWGDPIAKTAESHMEQAELMIERVHN